MEELKGSEFLLDGYITLGEAKEITIGGCKYSLQYYQGDHEDEYTLTRAGKVCLFQNGILKMYYEVDADDTKSATLPDLKMDVSLLSNLLTKSGTERIFIV